MNMSKNIVVVVLGNRLNDDGSISKFQEERLEMAIEIDELFNPKAFILSGGIANPIPNKSEALAMKEYLLKKGFNSSKLILEDKSHSTYENALYSVPIIKKLGADIVIICTSDYHLAESGYNTIKSFVSMLKDTDIKLMTYTKNTNM